MFSPSNAWELLTKEHLEAFFDVLGHAVSPVRALFAKSKPQPKNLPETEPEQKIELFKPTAAEIGQYGASYNSSRLGEEEIKRRVAAAIRRTVPLIFLAALLWTGITLMSGGVTVAARDGPAITFVSAILLFFFYIGEEKRGERCQHCSS